MREVVDGNGFFFLAAPGSGGGGGGESEEETARKDTEQESNTAADPIRVVPREKYIPSPPPFLPLCVSLFPSLSRACTQACFLYKFCTKSLRNNYSPSSPSAAVQTRHRQSHERTSSGSSNNNSSSRFPPPERGATTDLTVTVTITVAVTVAVTVLVGDGNSNRYQTITAAGSIHHENLKSNKGLNSNSSSDAA